MKETIRQAFRQIVDDDLHECMPWLFAWDGDVPDKYVDFYEVIQRAKWANLSSRFVDANL